MKAKKIVKKSSSGGKKFINEQLFSKAFALIQQEHQKNPAHAYDLFEMSNNPCLHLNVVVSELPKTVNIRPVRIPLSHPIYGKDHNTKTLVILTNEMYAAHGSLLKDALPSISVTSYHKIDKNYPEFRNKRDLLKSYNLFFCDQRVYPLLKKALGRSFYNRKKYPFPLELSSLEASNSIAADLEAILATCIANTTFFYQGNGPEYSVKFARLFKMTADQACENAKLAFKGLVKVLIQRGLTVGDVRRIVVKSDKSESFPIYTHLKPHELALVREILASGP